MKKKIISWTIAICLIMTCVVIGAITIARMSRNSHACNHNRIHEAEHCEEHSYCLDCGENLSLKEHTCTPNGFACVDCHEIFKTVTVKVKGIMKPTTFTDMSQITSKFPELIVDDLSIKNVRTSFDGNEFDVEFDIELESIKSNVLVNLCGDSITKYMTLEYNWKFDELDAISGSGKIDSVKIHCAASIPSSQIADKFNVTIEFTPHMDNGSWYKTCTHNFQVVSAVAATYESAGSKVLQCDACGYRTTSVIPKMEKPPKDICVHSFVTTDRLEPTCLDSGVETRVCTKCAYSETIRLEKVSCITQGKIHDEHKDSTCIECGYHKYFCDVCGKEVFPSDLGSSLPLVAHDFQLIGNGVYRCRACGMIIDVSSAPIRDYQMSVYYGVSPYEHGNANANDYAVFHYIGRTTYNGELFFYGIADMTILEANSSTTVEFTLTGINPPVVSVISKEFIEEQSKIKCLIVFPESWGSGAPQMDVPWATFW